MRIGIRTIRSMRSSDIRESLAPIDEPINAAIIVGMANFRFIRPLLMNFPVEMVVPIAEDSLFVAIEVWVGSPAKRYAGSDIRPPPPAIESTNPARKTSGQIIR